MAGNSTLDPTIACNLRIHKHALPPIDRALWAAGSGETIPDATWARSEMNLPDGQHVPDGQLGVWSLGLSVPGT
jgi:hypothetical protein